MGHCPVFQRLTSLFAYILHVLMRFSSCKGHSSGVRTCLSMIDASF